MAIRAQFTQQEFERSFRGALENIDRAVLYLLNVVGETAVNRIKRRHVDDWTDRTKNLRASVGYVIVRNGEIVSRSGFEGAQEGVSAGKSQADMIAAQYGRESGWVLIMVTGMYYGVYVEKRGYNVLMWTEADAKRLADRLIKKMFKK
jgi:hypothetical protein